MKPPKKKKSKHRPRVRSLSETIPVSLGKRIEFSAEDREFIRKATFFEDDETEFELFITSLKNTIAGFNASKAFCETRPLPSDSIFALKKLRLAVSDLAKRVADLDFASRDYISLVDGTRGSNLLDSLRNSSQDAVEVIDRVVAKIPEIKGKYSGVKVRDLARAVRLLFYVFDKESFKKIKWGRGKHLAILELVLRMTVGSDSQASTIAADLDKSPIEFDLFSMEQIEWIRSGKAQQFDFTINYSDESRYCVPLVSESPSVATAVHHVNYILNPCQEGKD